MPPWLGATQTTDTMNFKQILSRSGFERSVLWEFYLAALMMVGATSGSVQARGILAHAWLSGVPLGRGEYSYTLTLSNTAASTSDIQLFWFAWESGGADFLTSEPTSIQTPTGWNSVVDGGGAGDGYSIQFNTFTTPLTPGSALTFTFKSPDSPKLMSEPASLYPEYPTLTSQVYSGHAAEGLQEVIVAQVVPSASLTNLSISMTGRQIILSWPTNAASYVLQATTNIYAPSGWAAVTNVPSVSGSLKSLTLPMTNTGQFFRLRSE